MNKKKNIITFAAFLILMVGLGANDAMRGIFSTIFSAHFQLSTAQLSQIVTVSYIGNLVFLAVGGFGVDILGRRKAMLLYTFLWSGAMLLFATTDSYLLLLVGMFFAMGTSTLLNTNMNLITTGMFAAAPGFFVNFLFFIQGIGTSGSQFLLGRFAFSYDGWKMINGVLFAVGLVSLVLFAMVNLKPEKIKPKTIQKKKPQDMPGASIFWFLVLMMGFYFIGEHGIMNWMLTYCMNALQMPSHTASTYLSIFWGGMTVGRLVFAPVVQKLGVRKSLKYFGGAGTVLFVTGVLSGSKGVILLSSSGLLISILYPTMVLFFQQIYPVSVVATKTGAIISAATIADIVFNAGFGALSDSMGIQISFLILPVCMVLYYCFYLLLLRVSPSEV